MTHDPMHNVEGLSGALYDGSLGPCRLCEFAARVRADEREKFEQELRNGTFGCEADIVNRDAVAFLNQYRLSST